MKEKIICITTPADRTYYLAKPLAKEFVDREQNVVHTMGTLPEGQVTELTVSSATLKSFHNGKLDGKLEVINLTDGTVSFSEEYKEGNLQQIHESAPQTAEPAEPQAPRYTGTTLKTSKGAHSFYSNGKEVAEETIASNGATLELLGNIPDGEVKEFDENDKLITLAHYKDNKLNGELVRYAPDGRVLAHELYTDGFLQGEASYCTYTQKDVLTAICHYKNSRLHGERTLTQQNGTLRCREFYKNGHLSGPRLCYYENGNKEREENYTDGKLDGKRELFFPEGTLWYQENYSNGRLSGERTGFFPTGKHYLEEFYADGMLEGHRNIYKEDGSLLASEQYHWGTLVNHPERRDK
ncbi:MAG: toxin-antitoxin system YwqK family antitoxin [Elusimicrobiaceae bacterium]|nr:toxin-antitoxin system YwqK family antitoxin [Elusimicrobiaceae bacterium]